MNLAGMFSVTIFSFIFIHIIYNTKDSFVCLPPLYARGARDDFSTQFHDYIFIEWMFGRWSMAL